MQSIVLKTLSAGAWASAVVAAGVLGGSRSVSSWLAVGVVALTPPLILMWQWQAPPQTTSERIGEVLR